MNDLRFIIVNSKLQHSQALRHELEKRVSFDVYQDTEEKNIWKLMGGGKDDIYVYDRCGRLTYYIPFPLSIMTPDENLVPSAILATYYRSPCGETCDKTVRSSLEEYLNKVADPTETTTEEPENYVETATYVVFEELSTEQQNETFYIEKGNTSKAAENESDFYSSEDFDYPFYNDTVENLDSHESNETHLNNINEFLYENVSYNDTEDSNSTLSINERPSNVRMRNISNENPLILTDDQITYNDTKIEKPVVDEGSKRRLERCAEADLSVCNNWSKRRLLRAQNCCNGKLQYSQSCRNFGKKRCKKIRTVLKCCIKTAYVEKTTEEPFVDNVTTQLTEPVIEIKYEIVCCKYVAAGKLCRVATTSTCEGDEFISEGVDSVDIVQSENKP